MLSWHRKFLDASTYKTLLPSSALTRPMTLFKKAPRHLSRSSVAAGCYNLFILLYLQPYCTAQQSFEGTHNSKNTYLLPLAWKRKGSHKQNGFTVKYINQGDRQSPQTHHVPMKYLLQLHFSSTKDENSASNPSGTIIHLLSSKQPIFCQAIAHPPSLSPPFPGPVSLSLALSVSLSAITFQWDFN